MSVPNSPSGPNAYAAAGVDVTAGYEAVARIKPLVESTRIPGVMGSLGGFGGLFAPNLEGMKKPVLVSGADGVGTKLKIAFLMDRHNTVGIDCVAMCVNDIACSGATPLFFLDYLALGKNDPEQVADIVAGVAEGCRYAGCALIGGETAEMPGFYPAGEYDLAGFAVGMVDEENLIDGSALEEGDLLVGLASSGLHSNGFSLVRKVLSPDAKSLSAHVPALSSTLGEALLRPTRIYVKALCQLKKRGIRIKAAAHITGGGLYENVPRMMRPGLAARIDTGSFPVLPIFDHIARAGSISEQDMYHTFNMGLGMVLAISRHDVGLLKDVLCQCGERTYIIGSVVASDQGVILV